MGERRDEREVCRLVEWTDAIEGGLMGCWAVSSAMERNELPERRSAASFVERVKAERPWFICSGNLKSMDTVLASCAI